MNEQGPAPLKATEHQIAKQLDRQPEAEILTFDFEERKALLHLNNALRALQKAKHEIAILEKDPVIVELMGEELDDIKRDIHDAIIRDHGERGIEALIAYIRQP